MEQKLGSSNEGMMVLPNDIRLIEYIESLDDEQVEALQGRHAVRYISSQIVSKMSNPELIETYVYSFPQGGKTVIDLSFKGVMAVAQWWGNMNIISYSKEERDNSILVEVHARDILTNLDAIAAVEQSKVDESGKPDKFAYPKAFSKALRDVYKKLIPIEIFAKMARTFLDHKNLTELEIAKTAVSGSFTRLGYDESLLFKFIQHKFNKEPDTLTLSEWQQLRSSANSKQGEIVLKNFKESQ